MVLLIALYVKVRKVHLATYRLLDDVAQTRRETEALIPQAQALMALDRSLGLTKPLPPTRGWAGSPDFLLALTEEAFRRKPKVVVECSSGVSTIVIARCLQLNGAGHVWSLEHEAQYAVKTRRMLAEHGLSDWATVLDAPLQTIHTDTPWYREEELPQEIGPIEMLVVDGPPSAVAPLARAPAMPRLRERMAPNFVVMIDDADRPDETEMIRRWCSAEPRLREIRVACEKGLAVLELTG